MAGQMRLRGWRDFISALLTLALACMYLGLNTFKAALLGTGVNLSHLEVSRALVGSLPTAALLIFAFSYKRFTPWFVGVFAALLMYLLPLPIWARLLGLVVLSVILGQIDLLVRGRAKRG